MSNTIRIRNLAGKEDIHRFRNFGEDVWKKLRDDCDLTLGEIDSITSEFKVKKVKDDKLQRTVATINTIAKEHFIDLDIKIEK